MGVRMKRRHTMNGVRMKRQQTGGHGHGRLHTQTGGHGCDRLDENGVNACIRKARAAPGRPAASSRRAEAHEGVRTRVHDGDSVHDAPEVDRVRPHERRGVVHARGVTPLPTCHKIVLPSAL